MHVAIDETRHQRQPLSVDPGGVGRHGHPVAAASSRHRSVLDYDDRAWGQLRGSGIEEGVAEDSGDHPAFFTTSPPLTTRWIVSLRASSSRFSTGSPGTPTRSPKAPSARLPARPVRSRTSAATVVALRIQSGGLMPSSRKASNSSPLLPWGPTPASVPKAMVTLAAIARRTLTLWSSAI